MNNIVENEYDEYEEETRGDDEIHTAINELIDKVWLNRHKCMLHHIKNGDIRIVPDGINFEGGMDKSGKKVIPETVYNDAKKHAQQVMETYKNTGPWTDFEWGMLNGKLSALRWVLGDEWDYLDT